MDQKDRLVIVLILMSVLVFWGFHRTTGLSYYKMGAAAGSFVAPFFPYLLVGFLVAVFLALLALHIKPRLHKKSVVCTKSG